MQTSFIEVDSIRLSFSGAVIAQLGERQTEARRESEGPWFNPGSRHIFSLLSFSEFYFFVPCA